MNSLHRLIHKTNHTAIAVWFVFFIVPGWQITAAEPDPPLTFDQKLRVPFRHVSPQSPKRHIHLTMGSGVGALDYDLDGFVDLYFGQGGGWTGTLDPESGLGDVLCRNITGEFLDVTKSAMIFAPGYAMGISVGDCNNDGFPDVYVSNVGRDRLYSNNGDGTFTEQSEAANLKNSRYGASCAWTDFQSDGVPDLFVVNYVQISPENYKTCTDQSPEGKNLPIACPPWTYTPEPDCAYVGRGDGTFVEASKELGFQTGPSQPGLGIITADIDRDGDLDLYIANDSTPNQLWINNGGEFNEQGLLSGTALNRVGEREAGMGVTCDDADNNGLLDLFVTNYFAETNTFYRNEGFGFFLDVTPEVGLASASYSFLGFGTSFVDFDNDGELDLFVTNGHIHDQLNILKRDVPYQQQSQVFRGRSGKFEDVTATAGAPLQKFGLGRGTAIADFDRDGRPDIAVNHLDQSALLLRNTTEQAGHPLRLLLIGTRSSRLPVGAIVTVETPRQKLTRTLSVNESYLSSRHREMVFGILPTPDTDDTEELSPVKADRITVHWPSGKSELWQNLTTDELHVLVEGTGTPILSENAFPE
ncbi:FG-GAP repeat protein [Thalassoglobus neptunius]|uniref:FG-GAP repeat protein n=1 Tax=Thalassoglobus neptunius TaxID=1938619 RepID=A0A5C5WHQ3_9PLAN|nr:CRTAC1 family protein [Thalassoglobus neptunius]TWT50087.1 FG-GAP repeat protein [Thalassoglobus neptunius]